MNDREDSDPYYSVWGAVAELEKKGYTRAEIADALVDVGIEMKQH